MPRILSAALACTALLIAACSVVPEPGFPPFAEYQIEAVYTFEASGAHRAAVPGSAADVTVLDLQTEPAAVGESFSDDRRWLLVPPGCERFTVRCRYRDYAAGTDGAIRLPSTLFPGARTLQVTP